MFDYTANMRWHPELFLIAGILSAGEGLTPRPLPEDFPVHQNTVRLAIGAEFMVHSFGRDSERYVNEDYLTVEVGVYPANRNPILISAGQFTLRVNAKKEVLNSATPSLVASSLKYNDWEQRVQLDGQDGQGSIGRPSQSAPRFPGDNRPNQGRLPAPPQVSPDPALAPPTHIAPSVLVKEVAIEEGEHKFPAGGYLYFPYRGKIKSIRSLDLIYNNGAESITLRLR